MNVLHSFPVQEEGNACMSHSWTGLQRLLVVPASSGWRSYLGRRAGPRSPLWYCFLTSSPLRFLLLPPRLPRHHHHVPATNKQTNHLHFCVTNSIVATHRHQQPRYHLRIYQGTTTFASSINRMLHYHEVGHPPTFQAVCWSPFTLDLGGQPLNSRHHHQVQAAAHQRISASCSGARISDSSIGMTSTTTFLTFTCAGF